MDRIIRIRRAVRAFFRCSLWLWLTAGIIPGARIVPGRADAVAHHQKGVEAQRDLQALCRLSVGIIPKKYQNWANRESQLAMLRRQQRREPATLARVGQ